MPGEYDDLVKEHIAATQPDVAAAQPEDPYAGLVQEHLENKNLEKQRIDALYRASLNEDTDRFVQSFGIASRLGIDVKLVEPHLEEFKRTEQAAGFDPLKWRRENPHLAIMLNEDARLAPMAFSEETESIITKSLGALGKAWAYGQKLNKFAGGGGPGDAIGRAFAVGQKQDIPAPPTEKELFPAPKVTNQLVGPAFESDPTGIVQREFARTTKQSDLNSLYTKKVMALAMGLPLGHIDEEIQRLEEEIGPETNYGQGQYQQFLIDAAQGTASSIPPLKAFGVVGGASAAVAGGVTLAATKGNIPAALVAAKATGAAMGGAATYVASADQEIGSAFADFSRTRTDDGKLLDPNLAAGMAVVYGFISAGIETGELAMLADISGPLGQSIKAGNGRAFIKEAVKNKKVADMFMAAGKAWLKSIPVEGLEEGAQQSVQLAVEHYGKEAQAGKPQQVDWPRVENELRVAIGKGAAGGALGTGQAVASVHLVGDMVQRAQEVRGAARVNAIVDIAESKPGQAVPKKVAELVERHTAETGEPVTHLYVNPSDFITFFQENGADPGDAAIELLGEQGAQDLNDAAATGQKFAIPVEKYIEKWGGTGIARALADRTTTRPGYDTKVEMEANQAEIDAEAKTLTDAWDAAQKKAGEAGEAPVDPATFLEPLRESLTKTGKYSPDDVKKIMSIFEQFTGVAGEKFGIAPAELFKGVAAMIQNGTLERLPDGQRAVRLDDTGEVIPLKEGAHEQGPQPESPEFKAWFKESKAVDEQGKPLVVYHGTTHNFDEFSKKGSNPGNWYGRGMYFTDSHADLNANYATETGPDLTNRIAYEAEKTAGYDFNDPSAYEAAKEKVKKKLVGSGANAMPVYLSMQNPVVVEPNGGTRFEYIENFDEETGDPIGKPKGNGVKLLKAIEKTVERYNKKYDAGIDAQALIGHIMEKAPLYEEPTAHDVETAIREYEPLYDVGDHEGEAVLHEFIRDVWKAAGFDGIVMDASRFKNMEGAKDGAKHYIVFKPTQIKSATGNRGTFDPKNPNILMQENEADKSEPFWYSAAERAVEYGPRKRGNAKAWWAYLTKAEGVKKEELEYLNMKEMLDGLEGDIPKEVVLEYIRAHRIDIKENILGEPRKKSTAPDEGDEEAIQRLRDERDRITNELEERHINVSWRGPFDPHFNMYGYADEEVELEGYREVLSELRDRGDIPYSGDAARVWDARLEALENGDLDEVPGALSRDDAHDRFLDAFQEARALPLLNAIPVNSVPENIKIAKAWMESVDALEFTAQEIETEEDYRQNPGEYDDSRSRIDEVLAQIPEPAREAGYEYIKSSASGAPKELIEQLEDWGVNVRKSSRGGYSLSYQTTRSEERNFRGEEEILDYLRNSEYADGDVDADEVRELFDAMANVAADASDADINIDPDYAAPQTARGQEVQYKRNNWYTPGETANSYREILFYAPGSEKFTSSHFGLKGEGLLAHARYSEQYLDAEASKGEPFTTTEQFEKDRKVFFIDEIQSDLHQKGRDLGYRSQKKAAMEKTAAAASAFEKALLAEHEKSPPALEEGVSLLTYTRGDMLNVMHDGKIEESWPSNVKALAKDLIAARAEELRFNEGDIPDAPFKTSWDEMVVKRLLYAAAEKGYAKIAWTTGKTQAKRWSQALENVERIVYNPKSKILTAYSKNGGSQTMGDMSERKLGGEIGAANARRLLSTTPDEHGMHTLEGLDMTIGGKGMEAAYDERITNLIKKRVKQYGGVIEDARLNSGGAVVHTATLPEEFRQKLIDEGIAYFQGAAEKLKEDPRGLLLQAREGLARLFRTILLPGSDASTVIHEAGHIFLEMFGDLAEREDAPQQVKDDWAATLKHLGAEDRAGIKREHHEKWARSWEAYLYTGEAPSPALVSVFQRFKNWLRKIYRSIKSLNVDLNDDIKGVFDRLLATDEELEAMKGKTGLSRPMYRSPAESGMSPEEHAAYLDGFTKATERARDLIDARILKDKLRETEKWWKKEHRELRNAAGEEYDQKPEVVAWRFLRTGKSANQVLNSLGKVTIDREDVVDAVGEETADKKFRGVATKRNGMRADALAELLGYETGHAMLKALAAEQPDRATYAKEQADQQMKEKHGDLLEERDRLREEVAKSLHNEFTSTWLLKEFRALSSKVTPGPGGGNHGLAFKRAAEQIAERKLAGNLRPYHVLQAERKSANAAIKAAAKGDNVAAFGHKQQQLLNHFLYSEMRKAVDDRDALLELADKLSDDKARARLGKASPKYRDGVDGMLEGLGLAAPRERDVPTPSLAEVTQVLEDNGATIVFDPEVVNRALAKGDWHKLTVAEMREVFIALTSVKQAASNQNSVIFDGKRADKETIVAMLMAEAGRLPDLGPPVEREVMHVGQRIMSYAAAFDGASLRPETTIKWLADGDINAAWYKAILFPLLDAKAKEADILKDTIKPILDGFQAMPKSVLKTMNDKIDGAALFPNHRADLAAPSRRFQLLMMALNLGNESNKSRLLEGRNISEQEVTKALDVLTKEEWDWVQSVWDSLESLWPAMRDLEEQDTGLVPPRVKPSPVKTKFGEYRGGYFPAVYNRDVEQVGERQAAQTVASLMDPSYTRPGTSHGHLKSRAQNFAGAIALDPTTIRTHLIQAAHDIAFRMPVKSVGSLILDPGVDFALKRRLGPERARQFLQWVKDAGQMRGAQISAHLGAMERALSTMRANVGYVALGYKLNIPLADLSNLALAPASTDIKSRFLVGGIGEFIGKRGEAIDFVREKSGQMRARHDQLQRDLVDAIGSLTVTDFPGRAALEAYKKHAFIFMEASDKLHVPIWIGRYRQAIADNESEENAIRLADRVVGELFPSHSAVDRAGLLRDKGFIGSSLIFQGFMNLMYNRFRDIGHDVRMAYHEGELAETAAKAAVAMVMTGAALALGEALTGRYREKDEEWYVWLLRQELLGFIKTIPIAGGFIDSIANGKKPSARVAPGFAAVEQAGKAAFKVLKADEMGEKELKEILTALGLFTGVPTKPLDMGLYFMSDDRRADSFKQMTSDVLYGDRDNAPLNPITMWGSDL